MGLFGAPNINKLKKNKNYSKLIKAVFNENNTISKDAIHALAEIGIESLTFLETNFHDFIQQSKLNPGDAQKKMIETIIAVANSLTPPPDSTIQFLVDFANQTEFSSLKVECGLGLAKINPPENEGVNELFYQCLNEVVAPSIINKFIKALSYHLSDRALIRFLNELKKDRCKKEIADIGLVFGKRALLLLNIAAKPLNNNIVPRVIAKILVSLSSEDRHKALSKYLVSLSGFEPFIMAKALITINELWVLKYIDDLNLLAKLPHLPNSLSEKLAVSIEGCKLLMKNLKAIYYRLTKLSEISENEWESVECYGHPLKNSRSGWQPFSLEEDMILAWGQFDLKKLSQFGEKAINSMASYLKPRLKDCSTQMFKGQRREIYPVNAFGSKCIHELKKIIQQIPDNLKEDHLQVILNLPDDIWENVLSGGSAVQYIKLNLNELKYMAQTELSKRFKI